MKHRWPVNSEGLLLQKRLWTQNAVTVTRTFWSLFAVYWRTYKITILLAWKKQKQFTNKKQKHLRCTWGKMIMWREIYAINKLHQPLKTTVNGKWIISVAWSPVCIKYELLFCRTHSPLHLLTNRNHYERESITDDMSDAFDINK